MNFKTFDLQMLSASKFQMFESNLFHFNYDGWNAFYNTQLEIADELLSMFDHFVGLAFKG